MEFISLVIGVLMLWAALKMDDNVIYHWYAQEYRKKRKIRKWGLCLVIIVLCLALYHLNSGAYLSFWTCLIQAFFTVFSFLILLLCVKDFQSFVPCFFVFMFIATSCLEFVTFTLPEIYENAELEKIQEQSIPKETIEEGISWDYSNPEILRTEYSIMGVSGENIMIKAVENGEEILRSIRMDEIEKENSDGVLIPYLYRNKYVYTEYNYEVKPPEALRKGNETWSKYILCGSNEQIETLLNGKKRGLEWDWSNPEIVVREYQIVSVSSENIEIKVVWDGEETLRTVPMNEITLEITNDVETPYLYRKNFIYTEYDYDVEPRQAVRENSESWSKYILRGSEKQIQSLFGYEVEMNFEQ